MSTNTKVAIDIRDLKKGKTGTYTYLHALCQEFEKKEGGVQYFFIQYPLPVYQGKNKFGKITEHLLFTIWKQFVLPIYCIVNRIDVLFCTDYFLPLLPMSTKKIVVFHDTFFYEEPKYYNALWLKTFHWVAESAVKGAAQVIVPTQYVKEKLIEYIPQLKTRITVVYEGPKKIKKGHNKQWEEEVEEWLNGSKYLLHVGTLDHRKNLIKLVAAFELLIKDKSVNQDDETNIKLIIAGDSPKYFTSNGKKELVETIQKKQLGKSIFLTGRVSETQLDYLYQNAHAYVFPSNNEGFGLPMVEAMQYNIPIAAANNTALPEVGGNAAIYFEPQNEEAITAALKKIVCDDSIRNQLKAAAEKRIAVFNWSVAANQLERIFKNVNQKIA